MTEPATKGYVECPNCKGIFFSITRQFRKHKAAHPDMVQMLRRYRNYGWEEPPRDVSAGFGCLECPQCGFALAPNGRLTVVKKVIADVEG
jgi:DNA-directed RNA polymerase subunit RPC12/RpoP